LLDTVHIGHFAIVAEDAYPVVLPTAVVRDGDRVLAHGSTGSRWQRHLAAGAPTCLAVTAFDALVVARSAFQSSMRYRSAVLSGQCQAIGEQDAKRLATGGCEQDATARSGHHYRRAHSWAQRRGPGIDGKGTSCRASRGVAHRGVVAEDRAVQDQLGMIRLGSARNADSRRTTRAASNFTTHASATLTGGRASATHTVAALRWPAGAHVAARPTVAGIARQIGAGVAARHLARGAGHAGAS
jgi:hypothetical protein